MRDRPAGGGTAKERARPPGSTRTPGSNRGRMVEVGSGGGETPGPPTFNLGGERRREVRRGMQARAQTVATALAAEFQGEQPPPKEDAVTRDTSVSTWWLRK